MFRSALLAHLVLLSVLVAQVPSGAEGSQEWQSDLGWLPPNTETLVVASQPFTIPEFGEEGDEAQQLAAVPLAILQHLALGPLTQFPEVYSPLVGRRVRLAFTGICEFLPMSGMGLGPVNSASVIRFDGPLGEEWESFLWQYPAAAGSTVHTFSMIRYGSLRTKPETVSLLIVQPAPDLLILATDADVLKTVLWRRIHGGSVRALSDTLPNGTWLMALLRRLPFGTPASRGKIVKGLALVWCSTLAD